MEKLLLFIKKNNRIDKRYIKLSRAFKKAEALEAKSFRWDGDLISFLIYEALGKVLIIDKNC